MSLVIDAGVVALASAIVPSPGNKFLSQLYKLSLNDEGFFQEAHAKLRPVDFATDGVFMAGIAHGPKPVEEIIAHAEAYSPGYNSNRAGNVWKTNFDEMAKKTVIKRLLSKYGVLSVSSELARAVRYDEPDAQGFSPFDRVEPAQPDEWIDGE